MADIKPIGKALFLREEELRRGIEMMFFAYRDFTSEADSILVEQNMGRAHHRATGGRICRDTTVFVFET